jgi:hypothetical protein
MDLSVNERLSDEGVKKLNRLDPTWNHMEMHFQQTVMVICENQERVFPIDRRSCRFTIRDGAFDGRIFFYKWHEGGFSVHQEHQSNARHKFQKTKIHDDYFSIIDVEKYIETIHRPNRFVIRFTLDRILDDVGNALIVNEDEIVNY